MNREPFFPWPDGADQAPVETRRDVILRALVEADRPKRTGTARFQHAADAVEQALREWEAES